MKTTSCNDDSTVSGNNQLGPTWNTHAQVAAGWATSTCVAVTSYQGTVTAIVPDVIEEEEEGSEDESINQLSVIDQKWRIYYQYVTMTTMLKIIIEMLNCLHIVPPVITDVTIIM